MWRTLVLCFLLLITDLGQVIAQNVKVESEVNGYEGEDVYLRCVYAGSSSETRITQVAWAKFSSDKKQNIAVYNPQYGFSFPVANYKDRISFKDVSPQSLNDATIVIKSLKNDDDGLYTCEFATYPNGNEEGNLQLNVLVKPNSHAEPVSVNASSTEAAVAVCTAADGKPPAIIRWESSLQGNFTSTSTKGSSNGTTTVTSHYRIVPTDQANQKTVTCIIEHKAMKSPQSIPVVLSVQYLPVAVIKGYDDNWYLDRKNVFLLCEAYGNPAPSKYEWKLINGTRSEMVNSGNPRLTVERVDASFNGTLVCEVTNNLGTVRVFQHILVREVPEKSNAGAIAGGVIGATVGLLLIGLLVFFLKKRSKEAKGYPERKIVCGEPPTHVLSYKGEYDVQKPLNTSNNVPSIEELPRSSDDGSMEKPKYELSDDEDEERFNEVGPMLRMSRHYDQTAQYMDDDDMESQRDGSIISKTAVYV